MSPDETIDGFQEMENIQAGLVDDDGSSKVVTPTANHAIWFATMVSPDSGYFIGTGIDMKGKIAFIIHRPQKEDKRTFNRRFDPVAFDDYRAALARSETPKDTISFIFTPKIQHERRRVGAVARLALNAQPFPESVKSDDHWQFKKELFHYLLMGKGFWVPLEKLSVPTPLNPLPELNLFQHISPSVGGLCMASIFFGNNRERAEEYFSDLTLGIGVISAPEWGDRFHISAVVASMMCFNRALRQVYVSTPSDPSTDVIATQIQTLSDCIIRQHKLEQQIFSTPGLPRLMAVRGYSPEIEVNMCMKLLKGEVVVEKDSAPWRLCQSLCQWTLRALGARSAAPLTKGDSEAIRDLAGRLDVLATSDLADSPAQSDISEKAEQAAPVSDPEFARRYKDLVLIARGRLDLHDYYHSCRNRKGSTLYMDLKALMAEVCSCADVLATTPDICEEEPYQTFNNTLAKGLVLAEAGSLTRGDALMLIGNTPRPMLLVGHEKQPKPTIKTAFESLPNGTPVNRFKLDGQMSMLAWLIQLSWPILRLELQDY